MTTTIPEHDTSHRPFHIDVPEGDVDDLRERLAATRRPRPGDGSSICSSRKELKCRSR